MKLVLTLSFVMLFGVLVAACNSEAAAPASTPAAGVSQVQPPSPTPAGRAGQPSSPLAGGPDLFRAKAFAYWDDFNRYDLDAVMAAHEPAYLLEREGLLRRDIGLLRQFGVTLGLEEHVSPVRNDRGEWEMLLLLQEPTGLRVIRMAWVESGGRWLLIDAAEVSE